MTIATVWVWLPNESAATRAGEFEIDRTSANARGRFTYARTFLENPARYPLDPVALAFSRRPIAELQQDGIFGILLDAGPDTWGRKVLALELGYEPDPLEALLRSRGDGAGNIALGEPEGRIRSGYPPLDALKDVAEFFERIADGTTLEVPRALQDAGLDRLATSLGGMKPKLTVRIDDQLWIAKFPDRGDLPYASQAEHAMLLGARKAGIAACESRIYPLPGGRSAILVRRFDRKRSGREYERLGYASAHTVMHLKKDHISDMRRSYLNFSDEVRRWCADEKYPALADQRELWRRIVFNALIGNTDDHPRNHGLVRAAQGWRLSPAFDLVPHAAATRMGQAMPFWMDEHGRARSDVSAQSLLKEVARFGYQQNDAIDELERMATMVRDCWRDWMTEAGMPDDSIERKARAFSLCDVLLAEVKDVKPSPPARKRGQRGARRPS